MFTPNRHFSPTKVFIARNEGLALVLNPKVLSTTTRQILCAGLKEFHGQADPSQGRYRLLHFARRFPMAPLRDYVEFIRRPERFRTYAFVRNPYARLASAWRNKFYEPHVSGNGADANYPRSVRQRHLAAIRAFASERNLPGGEGATLIPFETFLRYAADRPLGKRDHHWDAQSVVLMCDRIPYHRIFRIEEALEEGFVEVFSQIGFPADWVKEQLARPRNSSRVPRTVYDDKTAALAQPLCQPDLDRFGYDPQSWQGK